MYLVISYKVTLTFQDLKKLQIYCTSSLSIWSRNKLHNYRTITLRSSPLREIKFKINSDLLFKIQILQSDRSGYPIEDADESLSLHEGSYRPVHSH